MSADRVGARHARRARLVGWLLVAMGVILTGYVIVGSMMAAGSDNPWTGAFLPWVFVIGMLVGVPPLLIGIGVLNHRGTARWVGILLAAAGVIGSGAWLTSVISGHPGSGGIPWLGIIALGVMLTTCALVCWALATSGEYFGSRYWDLMFGAAEHTSASHRATWREWRDAGPRTGDRPDDPPQPSPPR